MEMCRACLSTGEGMVTMDEHFHNNFNILTSLNILLKEDIPLYTCRTCYDATKFCIEFRNKCIESDQTLKEILFLETITDQDEKLTPKVDNDEKNITIKEEVKSENDDDESLGGYSEMDIKYEEDYQVLSTMNTKMTNDDESESKNKIELQYDENCQKLSTINKNKITKRKQTMQTSKLEKKKISIDSKIYCKICPEFFENNNGLGEHLEKHKLAMPCVLCDESFVNLPHLLAHRIEHLPHKQKHCHICAKKFLTVPCLEFHYMRIHDFAEKDTQISCKKCSASFDSGKGLLRHINYVHSKTEFKSEFTCEHCAVRLGSKKQLKYHIRKHSETKPYTCDLCDYTSKYSGALRTHKLWKHTKGRVDCKTCTCVFASQELLDKHICKNALGIICPICGVHLKSRSGSSLNRHLKMHENAHQYKCEICPAKYKSMSNLKIHMDKHAGTPRHHCEYCKRSFYESSVLVKHKRTHTGEKPYVCTICNRGFTGNNNLKVHMKVHGIVNLINKKDSTE